MEWISVKDIFPNNDIVTHWMIVLPPDRTVTLL